MRTTAANSTAIPSHCESLMTSLKKILLATRGISTPSIKKISSIIYALFLTEINHVTTKMAVETPESTHMSSILRLGIRLFKSPVTRSNTKPIKTHNSILMILAKIASPSPFAGGFYESSIMKNRLGFLLRLSDGFKTQAAAQRDVLVGMCFVVGVDHVLFDCGKNAELDQ